MSFIVKQRVVGGDFSGLRFPRVGLDLVWVGEILLCFFGCVVSSAAASMLGVGWALCWSVQAGGRGRCLGMCCWVPLLPGGAAVVCSWGFWIERLGVLLGAAAAA